MIAVRATATAEPLEANATSHAMRGDGMSVTLKDPKELHPARRPKWLGGNNDLPLWRIDEAELGRGLRLRLDLGPQPTHGVIEPQQCRTVAVVSDA
jgi:hypothetical protein